MKSIEHTIDGKSVTFYSLPVGMIFECNKLGDSLATMLSTLFVSDKNDVEVEEITHPMKLEGIDDPYMDRQKTTKAIQPSMASLRVQQKKDGYKALIDALTSPDMQALLARMICRSAKEEKWDPETLMSEKLDTEDFIEAFKGMMLANKGALNALGKLSSLLKIDDLEGRVEKLAGSLKKS